MSSWVRQLKHSFYRQKGSAKMEMSGIPMILSTKMSVKQVLWLRRHLRRRDFEPYVIRALVENVCKGQICFEIGSWIGAYSILLSRLVGDSGQLYLFEPDPVARMACDENLHLNHCENSLLFPFAISDSKGERLLYNGGSFGNSNSSLVASAMGGPSKLESKRVIACTLDSFVEVTGRLPDFVKIDVEGAEDKVIEGGKDVLSEKGVKIVIEVHGKLLRQREIDPGSLIAKLKALNKRVWLLGAASQEIPDENSQTFTELPRFHILARD
jgi:FkbM family methyltransferase